jgi:arylsulfatase A-like enzyme
MSGKLRDIFSFRRERQESYPRNVILIVIDALRYDGLSCFGNARKTSPNIDSLARKGVIFENAISASGSTPGAMGAIMTSRFPLFITDIFNKDQTKVTDFGFSRFYSEADKPGRFPGDLPTLASILRDNGFETVGFSANPIMSTELNTTQGFDSYDEFPGEENWQPFPNAEGVTSRVIDYFLKNGDSRSFVFAHYMDTHHPYSTPHPFDGIYNGDFVEGMDNGDVDWKWFHSDDLDYLKNISKHARAMYDSQIRFLDHQLGRLFSVLRKKRILKDTLVLILSDHGDEFLEHGGTVHHPKLYEELVRIPFILYCPRITSARRVSRLVRSVDVLPTVLDAVGIENDYELDGALLTRVIRGNDENLPDYAYMDMPPFRGIRTEEWKLIRNERTSRIELYNLIEDPLERNDVADSKPSITSNLSGRLDAVVERLGTYTDTDRFLTGEGSDMSEEISRRLKGLGYL